MIKQDFAHTGMGQTLIVGESINALLRQDLTYLLWLEYGIKVKDPKEYTMHAIDSLLGEVWVKGNKFCQLDELGDISSTNFASWVDSFELEDYIEAGTVGNENVEVHNYEGVDPQENLRRAYSSIVRNHPVRRIRSSLESRFGIDILNEDAEITMELS